MRSVDGAASRGCSGFIDEGTGAAQRMAGIDDAGGDIEPHGGPATSGAGLAPLAANQYLQYRYAELAAEVDLLHKYSYALADALIAGENTTRMATIASSRVPGWSGRSATGACRCTAASATSKRLGRRALSATTGY
jgi:hypothetical protein